MSSGKGINRVNVTERDLGGVELLKDYGKLTTSQIQRLLYPTLQKAQTRLLRLYEAGLVQRFAYPVLLREGGKGEYVYHLKSRPKTALTLLRHTLKLNDIRIEFELACGQEYAKEKGQGAGQVNLVGFIPEYKGVKGRRNDQKPVRATEDTVGGRGEQRRGAQTLIPDAVICLENPATGKRALFFLEVDLGSEKLLSTDHYSLYKKIMLYKKYLETGGFERYRTSFGYDFKGFRVLTVMDSETRIARLRHALAKAGVQGFVWFTDTTTIKGANVLDKIWLMTDPSDDGKYSIVRN